MSVGAVNKQTGERIPTAGMPAVDSVLSGSSTNPVQNRVVKAALDEKADTDMVAADFNAGTSYTAGNYCVQDGKLYRFKNNHSGAWSASDVEEVKIAGELSSIKSGLTNVNVALSVPENTGKNVLPMTLAGIKSVNTSGTWNDNSYTYNGITYTIYDTNGKVTGIKLNGTATSPRSRLFLCPDMNIVGFNGYKMNGCPEDGENKYSFVCQEVNSPWTVYGSDKGNGATISNAETNTNAMIFINVVTGIAITDAYFYPMIRPANITDSTFAPYIPSVESRIEAVESGLDTVKSGLTNLTLKDVKHTRYEFNAANTSVEITIPTYKAYIGIAHHPWAENTGDIVIINSASAGNFGCYQTSNVFTITKSGNVLTFTNGAYPMYLDIYEIQS